MSYPLVCAVLLTCDRPEMTTRAIQRFRAQTYVNKWLLILDSSKNPTMEVRFERTEIYAHTSGGRTIGALRNEAAELAPQSDILVHWDSDDVSHPRRIEEQVVLLQASVKACVGYRELLFWDTRKSGRIMCDSFGYAEERAPIITHYNQAWLYRNPDPRWVAGASLCMWRSAWEACPFDDAPHEDQRWWLKNSEKCVGASAINAEYLYDNETHPLGRELRGGPRLICQMHAGGTEQIPRSVMESGGGGVWKRAAEFDSYCAERMRP